MSVRKFLLPVSSSASAESALRVALMLTLIMSVLVGLIVCSEATFSRLHRLWTDMGVALSSDDAFLALRGLRTLAVRLQRHTESALKIARWLRTRPEVEEVLFPNVEYKRSSNVIPMKSGPRTN